MSCGVGVLIGSAFILVTLPSSAHAKTGPLLMTTRFGNSRQTAAAENGAMCLDFRGGGTHVPIWP